MVGVLLAVTGRMAKSPAPRAVASPVQIVRVARRPARGARGRRVGTRRREAGTARGGIPTAVTPIAVPAAAIPRARAGARVRTAADRVPRRVFGRAAMRIFVLDVRVSGLAVRMTSGRAATVGVRTRMVRVEMVGTVPVVPAVGRTVIVRRARTAAPVTAETVSPGATSPVGAGTVLATGRTVVPTPMGRHGVGMPVGLVAVTSVGPVATMRHGRASVGASTTIVPARTAVNGIVRGRVTGRRSIADRNRTATGPAGPRRGRGT